MSTIKKTFLFFITILISNNSFTQNYLLVGGSGWDKIAIINKDTKQPEWSFQIPDDGECNSVIYTKAGDIAFTFSKGAALVDLNSNILFKYNAKANEEIQSISEIEGGYLLGISGHPARIVELNKRGKIKKELSYDIDIEDVHLQHRHIRKTKKGTYLIPIMTGSKIIELDSKGKLIREVKIDGIPFSITILPNSNWLVPCGDVGYAVEIDSKTGKIVKKIDTNTIGGNLKLSFVAETIRLKNGNTIISNWLGHVEDKSQPVLIELNPENEVIWKLESDTPNIGAISTVCPIRYKSKN